MSEVEMGIPLKSLLDLPAGAVYADKKGQANVRLTTQKSADGKNETVYVYASCDSLELQCYKYEKTIKSINTQLTSLRQQQEIISKNPTNAFLTTLKWLSLGFVIGVIATVITIVFILKRRRNE